jgi:hypothetical protein
MCRWRCVGQRRLPLRLTLAPSTRPAFASTVVPGSRRLPRRGSSRANETQIHSLVSLFTRPLLPPHCDQTWYKQLSGRHARANTGWASGSSPCATEGAECFQREQRRLRASVLQERSYGAAGLPCRRHAFHGRADSSDSRCHHRRDQFLQRLRGKLLTLRHFPC